MNNKKSIRKTILVIIIPIILETIFQVSANVVSAAMVGRLTAIDISAQEALNATTSANTIALLNGANILRVHDVKEAVEAIKIVHKIK